MAQIKVTGYIAHETDLKTNIPIVDSNSEWKAHLSREITIQYSGEVSDGYHTFTELYDHRCVLFACLIASLQDKYPVYKIKESNEWFIAGVMLPSGQVGYHLPMKLWEHVNANSEAPIYDGHTSKDALERLIKFVKST